MGQDTFCDGVFIGKIRMDLYGRYVGIGPDGRVVNTDINRPVVYRSLRNMAIERGEIYQVRKGVYRASPKSL